MFRLALAFGCTVAELQERLDSDELTEWMAYALLDPFGGKRGDYQAAMITANLMNAQVGEVKFKLNDFMLQFGPQSAKRSARMTGVEMRDKLRMMFGRKAG